MKKELDMKYFSELNAQDQDRVITRAMRSKTIQGLCRGIFDGNYCTVIQIYWEDFSLVANVLYDDKSKGTIPLQYLQYPNEEVKEQSEEERKQAYKAIKELYSISKVYMFDDKLRMHINIEETI